MARLVVAGCGNPLRTDDGLGWRVAERFADWPGVTLLRAQQPLPEWAPVLAEAEVAFFVDASVDVDRPRLRPVTAHEPEACLAHALSVEDVLALAERLYGRAPTAFLLELPAYDLGFGETCSAQGAQTAERAVHLLTRRLLDLR